MHTHTYLSIFIKVYLLGKQINLPICKLSTAVVKLLFWGLTIITCVLLPDVSIPILQVRQWRGTMPSLRTHGETWLWREIVMSRGSDELFPKSFFYIPSPMALLSSITPSSLALTNIAISILAPFLPSHHTWLEWSFILKKTWITFKPLLLDLDHINSFPLLGQHPNPSTWYKVLWAAFLSNLIPLISSHNHCPSHSAILSLVLGTHHALLSPLGLHIICSLSLKLNLFPTPSPFCLLLVSLIALSRKVSL